MMRMRDLLQRIQQPEVSPRELRMTVLHAAGKMAEPSILRRSNWRMTLMRLHQGDPEALLAALVKQKPLALLDYNNQYQTNPS